MKIVEACLVEIVELDFLVPVAYILLPGAKNLRGNSSPVRLLVRDQVVDNVSSILGQIVILGATRIYDNHIKPCY